MPRTPNPTYGIELGCRARWNDSEYFLFDAPEQAAQALWCFEMRDRDRPAVRLGRELGDAQAVFPQRLFQYNDRIRDLSNRS